MSEDFRIGHYWLSRVRGSAQWYAFTYDAGTREVRRRSLKTADFEKAKIKLAAIVLAEGEPEISDTRLITIFHRYWTEHSDHRPNPSGARRAGNLLLDFLGNDACMSALTRAKQREFIKCLHESGYSVGYIGRIQATISAALNRAVREDEGEGLRVPAIIVAPGKIAELLNAPEPKPDNWHPTLEQIAAFMDCAVSNDVLRCALLGVAFAGRPEAVRELSAEQFDERHGLLSFNQAGRRQTKKYRPMLPVPPRLLPLMPRLEPVASIDVFQREWREMLALAKLPALFRPKSLRHFMATEMRSRGVPYEQREAWMGHRRNSTNDRYGHFAPDYLKAARDCADAVLGELEDLAKKDIYRQVAAKPTLQRFDPINKNALQATIASSKDGKKTA